MEITLPAVPVGILTLAAFFAPYLVAVLNGILPFVKSPLAKRLVTVAVSVALAALVMVFYYAMTSEPLPSWPVFVILSILVTSASYALVTKDSASRIEERTSSA